MFSEDTPIITNRCHGAIPMRHLGIQLPLLEGNIRPLQQGQEVPLRLPVVMPTIRPMKILFPLPEANSTVVVFSEVLSVITVGSAITAVPAKTPSPSTAVQVSSTSLSAVMPILI